MRQGIIVAVALVLGACAAPKAPTPVAASASKGELGQMNRDFAAALNAKDPAKAASYYTEDAIMVPPGEAMVQGRAAIEAYWKGAIEAGGARDASVETLDAQSSGDLGFELGSFSLTVNGANGEATTEKGRYIELLKRGADGKWYSYRSIWNEAPK
jgi:uncharacterized protein (TIGR02246 family)